jgi:hypothetical protein
MLQHYDQLRGHAARLYERLSHLDDVHAILKRAIDEKEALGKGTRSSAEVAAAASGRAMSPPISPAKQRWKKLKLSLTVTTRFQRALDNALEQSEKLTRSSFLPGSPGASTIAPSSPRMGQSASFSTHAAVAGSSSMPWSDEEDFVLIGLIKRHGIPIDGGRGRDRRWTIIAAALERRHANESAPMVPRTSGMCQARWETLLNAYLSVHGVASVKTSSELLFAARKSSRNAELAMDEAASKLSRAKSQLAVLGRAAQRTEQTQALQRGWLRDHTHVRLHGSSQEHRALQTLIDEVGAGEVLKRKLAEADRVKAGVDQQSLEEELGLRALHIEVGTLGGGSGGRHRHFLRVRNTETAEICLLWEEPTDQRSTNPAGHSAHPGNSAFTQKLHGGETPASGEPASRVERSNSIASVTSTSTAASKA